MTRLSNLSLDQIPAGIERPGYDRVRIARGVVHFGPGAFHRAHQAAAFDQILAHDPRWGITGVSLHSRGVADALNPQDGLYTLALLDARTQYRVIGAIDKVLTHDVPQAILDALVHPDTHIISMTVTEKGYCLDSAGALDFAHPAIRADIEASRGTEWIPVSLTGWLVRGLQARRLAGLAGITALCCDNLADNGRKLQAATIALAETIDPETARWMRDHVAFPNAMVDAITPATDDALRLRVAEVIGLADAWPIQREAFTQWVIEDQFVGERPPLDLAGIRFAGDVRPFEAAKLRLLNGAHSTLAYVGLGRGHETVAEAMRDPALAAFVERLMREDIAPSLSMPAGFRVDTYISDIVARFANPSIRHFLAQIAWDGSQKLPYRLLDTIFAALASGRPIHRLALPIAAWLRFVERAARDGRSITDPLAGALVARAPNWRAILGMREIFGVLGEDPAFCNAVEAGLKILATGELEPVPA
ncbi:mannitol dehydrogenase family protein [Sphingobium yanoikuyae]|uniref:mannitol dehydrogenase family protein n=1 Tax=Sphingobium yanoikuyae TaxID=13690 RepID=UPI00345E8CE0